MSSQINTAQTICIVCDVIKDATKILLDQTSQIISKKIEYRLSVGGDPIFWSDLWVEIFSISVFLSDCIASVECAFLFWFMLLNIHRKLSK